MTETSIVELIFTFVFNRNFEFESMGLNGNGIVINKVFVELEDELELAKFIYSFRNIRNSFIKNVTTDKNSELELLIQHYVRSSLL